MHDSTLKNAGKSGDLDGWLRATTAALECANGDFLCMGLLSGFAGALVNLMQEPTFVLLNFAGTTSLRSDPSNSEVAANDGIVRILLKKSDFEDHDIFAD